MSDTDAYKKLRAERLQAIMGNESDFGKNIQHKMITSGPAKGQTAIGKWGILPATAQEVIKNSDDPRLNAFKEISRAGITRRMLRDPNLEKVIAEDYYDEVSYKQHGDEAAIAAGWNAGPNWKNKTLHNIMDTNEDVSDYVDNFEKNLSKVRSNPEQFQKIQKHMELPRISENEMPEEMPFSLASEAAPEFAEDMALPVAEESPDQQEVAEEEMPDEEDDLMAQRIRNV